ncbi:SgcJ/EcaC family oxidoreductase [Streptomyces sp. NPDC048612]|uniref:SgcJ/EcaC family oxidoreductase n=1 Tax=Streptomyces sp. NPDC048612 TaxID=3365579 RepID=UPI0037104C46
MTVQPGTSVLQSDDAGRITALFQELESAFTEQNAVRFDGCFTEDVVFTAVDGTRFVGWEALHAYHRERFGGHADGIETWYEIESLTFPSPDVAVVFFRQPIVMGQHRRENVGTWVLVRRDGQWYVSAAQNTGVVGTSAA